MPDLSNLSHFPEVKISIYLSRDEDFIAPAKKSIQILRYIYISYFSKKAYVVGTH